MRRFVLLALITICFFSSFTVETELHQDKRNTSWAVKVNSSFMNNMYLVDKDIYRSEQPSKEEFVKLEKFGIKEVLNLRSYHTDISEAKNTYIILHQVRMKAHRVKNKDVVKALRIIKNRKGPILIHCQHGSDRTGVVVAMYRIIFQGWSKAQAIEELKNGGFGYHSVFRNIISYIDNVDIEEIRKEVYQ